MLTKDPVNDTHAHFLEQSEETTVKNSPSFRDLSRSLLYSLPKSVQKKIQDNLLGVLDAHQVSQFRDDKRNKMMKQCEKSALMTQYHELEAAWENQKQAWLALNARLLKASFS